MTERGLPSTDGASACPFVAFGDDREGRSTSPDHRHRCFAESPPAPRALAHQEAYCLSSAFPVCPVFQDWARREAAHARGTGERAETAPTATATAGFAAASRGGLDPESDSAAGPHEAELDADLDAPSRARSDPGDLPIRRNPPRDWAAPPPWATGAGGNLGAGRSGQPGASDLLANRSVEGRGLAGSAADRLAGGPLPAPNPAAGLAASGAAGAAAAAAAGSTAAWSASAAGSASAAPDDELADLVRGRSSVPPPLVEAEDRPALPPTRPESDARSLPPRTGRRPSVSSTRQPGPEIPGPAWERMRRYEAYPTIRSRGMPGLSRVALLAGAVAIAAIALFMLPALLGIGGGPGSSVRPSGSGAGGGAVSSATVEPTTPPASSAQVYIVKSGDTLSKIAAKFGLKPEDLCAANAATVKNCDKIALGQELNIPAPGSGGVAGPSGSATP